MHEGYLSAISYSEVEYMGIWFLWAMLAAFGALSGLWAIAGFFLPRQKRTAMVCWCGCPDGAASAIRRYRWLHSLGVLRCPLILIDEGLTESEQHRIRKQGIILCTPEEFCSGLEQERRKIE